ncbi:hypothetical protein D9757_000224 [Collybiopsis confluens]|uniref:NAD-dependent protein deacylase n=1 Tax=Collybiopsis confluens TaxID=2823264 RepID=A0A8H5MH78_9AGAR|nr:hypothetical protein D9757_000224 [Collybiopsis confluens]
MSPSADIQQFLQVVKSCKRIIIVAGAGLSAASGIPTFRGKGGLWRKYDAMSLATPEAFRENPSLVWQFYNYRRETQAQPNAAHTAIARFSLPSVRESIAPGSKFTLITQNVDGLSSLALGHEMQNAEPRDKQDGPPRILEMHGRLFDVQCTECDHVKFDRSSPICEGLKGTEELVERNAMDPEIAIDSLPRCVKCGALARPGVVWFGEGDVVVEPGHFHYEANDVAGIQKIVEEADLCIVVGTASTVYPAAGFAKEVRENGGKVAVFNIERTSGDRYADFFFQGPCEDLLSQAFGLA